jgi:uncharacterized membrane protein YeaQ/YmgE (transglycosylase-associated protein family)
MKEIASLALGYLREHLLGSAVIAVAAGFTGSKTVVLGKGGNVILYVAVGLVGSFIGQFAIFYFGLREMLDELSDFFRLFFDFLAAYLGSFAIAALIHFVKPQ